MSTVLEIQLVEAAASGSDQTVTAHSSHVIKKGVKLRNFLLCMLVMLNINIGNELMLSFFFFS
jgi:hypothetical protein